jgi:hypothetical protein
MRYAEKLDPFPNSATHEEFMWTLILQFFENKCYILYSKEFPLVLIFEISRV